MKDITRANATAIAYKNNLIFGMDTTITARQYSTRLCIKHTRHLSLEVMLSLQMYSTIVLAIMGGKDSSPVIWKHAQWHRQGINRAHSELSWMQ